jgi:hypothetical protein
MLMLSMDEAGEHPLRPHGADPAADVFEEGNGALLDGLAPVVGHIGLDRIVEQARDIVVLFEITQPLERADPDMRMVEPHKDGGARRRRLVAAHQRLAGLDQAERFRRVDAERFQHLRRQHFAHAALQGQAAIGGA